MGGSVKPCVGWDLGGAHVKAALCREGRISKVWQVPCPLWQGIRFFEEAVASIAAQLPECGHRVTMTGEMADIFPDRETGVRTLLERFVGLTKGDVWVYAESKIIPLSEICKENTKKIASKNWQLPTLWLSKKIENGIFVDIGSTTTDLVPIINHRPHIIGKNDHQRLKTQELLYLGVIRTPLMALAQEIPFQGDNIPLMAEHFATLADVYRILEWLPPAKDQTDTADRGPKTTAASMQRLARTIGLDLKDAPHGTWHLLAQAFHEVALHRLVLACLRHLGNGDRLIGAGVGRFLLPELARRLRIQYQDFSEFVPIIPGGTGDFSAADCAPAVALALLSTNDMMPL